MGVDEHTSMTGVAPAPPAGVMDTVSWYFKIFNMSQFQYNQKLFLTNERLLALLMIFRF